MNKIQEVFNGINFRSIVGSNFYYFALIILVIGLPLSPFVTSIAEIGLGANWLIEGQFKRKWNIIKTNRLLWLFFLIPAVHLIWLINTNDILYALKDLKIKVPLFALPLIIGTSKTLSPKQINRILWYFTGALFAGALISVSIYVGLIPIEFNDIRGISIFISHIRFSLMIVFSISFLIWNLWKNNSKITRKWKVFSILLIVWFIIFLGILRSMTSWVVMILLFYLLFTINYKRIKNQIIKRLITLLSILIAATIFFIVQAAYNDYYTIKPVDFSKLPTHTTQGNPYKNDTTKTATERGYYYNILICWSELEQGWNEVSEIPFNSRDKNGYSTKHKIARYLTSLGLPKDLDGINQLDNKDIELIESGHASSVYKVSFKPYIKIYESIYEVDKYIKTGNANNKSISMRVEFLKTGFHILKNNFWTGVGTGDIKNSFLESYKESNSHLKLKNQHQAHNQYFTFAITFGIFGFIICMIGLITPFVSTPQKSYLLVCFCIIIFTSMLNEDTFATQAGVTFYALFYPLLIFHNKNLL